jgi:hypothetical protein
MKEKTLMIQRKTTDGHADSCSSGANEARSSSEGDARLTQPDSRDVLDKSSAWDAIADKNSLIKDLEEKNAAERYEAGMYKCLYDLWEKRAADHQRVVIHLLDVLKLAEATLNDVALKNGPIEALAPIRAALSKYKTPRT